MGGSGALQLGKGIHKGEPPSARSACGCVQYVTVRRGKGNKRDIIQGPVNGPHYIRDRTIAPLRAPQGPPRDL